MLTSYATPERSASPNFLEGQVAFSHPRLSNNRSVMPLDVRGCTRATLTGSACAYPTPAGAGNPLNPIRDGDRGLQLFPMNEEFPVSAGHKLALIKSLPFVHTARRYYRLDGLVRPSDRPRRGRPTALAPRKPDTDGAARAGRLGLGEGEAHTDPEASEMGGKPGKGLLFRRVAAPPPVNGGGGPLGKEVPLVSLSFLELGLLELSPGRVPTAMSFYTCGNKLWPGPGAWPR